MIPVLLLYSQNYPVFRGKNDSFWKVYKREMGDIPLKDTVLKSISDESNLLGEGLSKKGYNLSGIKDYVIRVYKKCFRKEDLQKEFEKPEKNYLNVLEEVVLCIPGKIDIVKKKTGKALGVDKYADRLHIKEFTPLQNMKVSREETLKSLYIYEQIKNFPVKSFKQAYLQMRKFCSKPGFQFDIISPNNILIDTKLKKINLIDPVTPAVNKPVHGDKTDFASYHGADSLYPILCDFLMHKEHLANLTDEEKSRWQKNISTIIVKCISAAESAGLQRNTDRLKILYERIAKFWNTQELCKRYDDFLELYSAPINQSRTIAEALNYKNSGQERINAITQLEASEFSELKPVFEKILEAPHQAKVELPEILNAVLDKLPEYGKEAKCLMPALEMLFDKEIFCTTKKRLYRLFITLEPENEKFLSEISKSANNTFEKNLYSEEFKELYKKSKKLKREVKLRIKNICKTSSYGTKVSSNLIDKLWISRTCANTGKAQEVSINNMIRGYNYIEGLKNQIPDVTNLVEIHKIVLANTPGQEEIVGRLRTPDTDELVKQIFNIKKDTKTVVKVYSASKDVVSDLEKLNEYIKDNYSKMNTFLLASDIFSEAIRIHPFINGNGRAVRLFTEQFLLSKGYRLNKWPEETLYQKLYSREELAEFLRQNSVKIVGN